METHYIEKKEKGNFSNFEKTKKVILNIK